MGHTRDGFDAGYSNLGCLKCFPVYMLKIDRAFVRDILQDSDDAAGGVEDQRQIACLRAGAMAAVLAARPV